MSASAESPLGVIHKLDRSSPAGLAAIGERLLSGSESFHCFGADADRQNLQDSRHLAILSDFSEAVTRAAKHDLTGEPTAPWRLLGIDAVRGQPPDGTAYRRPVGGAVDKHRLEVLLDKAHAYLPLSQDGIQVYAPDAQTRVHVQLGQLFLATPTVEHAVPAVHVVHVPQGALSLEFTLGQEAGDTNAAWVAYCDSQPNPTIA